MDFYTIQSKELWEEIKDKEIWTNDPTKGMFPDEYTWMLSMYNSRRNQPNPSGSLIWLWDTRPDLRRGGHGMRGTEMVLLKVRLDPEQVQVSDFDAWHFVLNNSPAFPDSIPYETTPEGCDLLAMQKSWEIIFDLPRCLELWRKDDPNALQFVQYVTGAVDMANVTYIRHFICK